MSQETHLAKGALMQKVHVGRPRSLPDRRIEITQKPSAYPGLWSTVLSIHHDDLNTEIEEPILATTEDAIARAKECAERENISDIVVIEES
jgi:hypothetical protein